MTKQFEKGQATSRPGFVEPGKACSAESSMPGWLSHDWFWGLPAVAIIVATVLFYYPALQGDFLWDDNTYISTESSLRTWHGLYEIWFEPGVTEQYYPLTFTILWLEYHIWGLNTFGYHLVTVLLHGCAGVLLWQVLASLRVRGALLAGAIFALHPVNVMSVAWMTELKNTLSGCLALGAGWAYIRFTGLGVYESKNGPDENRANTPRWSFYILALVLFQLAMLAKTAVSFLPITLGLILWWQKKRVTSRDLLHLFPMAAITILMGVLTIYVEQHSGGARGPDFHLGFMERVLVSGRSFWFYLSKLLFPYDLTFIYPRWEIDTGQWWQYLYPLATVGLLVGLWMNRGWLGRGVWVAFMHFYVTTSMLILIVVLYMMRYSFVSDHWQYFGSMGMLGLIAAVLTAGWNFFIGGGKVWGIGLSLGLLAGLGVLTWRQCGMYSDNERLFQTTIQRNPACWMAYNNLGLIFLQQGRLDDAMASFSRAVEINPYDAQTSNSLGLALAKKRQLNAAVEQFQAAVKLDPGFAPSYNNLGIALLQKGEVKEAIEQFQKAVEITPHYSEAYYNLGSALAKEERFDEAIVQFRTAVKIAPDYSRAYNNLGNALFQTGQVDEAMAQYKKALEIDPNYADAHYDLGFAFAQKGRLEDAMVEFQATLRLKPDFSAARSYLAQVEEQIRQLEGQRK